MPAHVRSSGTSKRSTALAPPTPDLRCCDRIRCVVTDVYPWFSTKVRLAVYASSMLLGIVRIATCTFLPFSWFTPPLTRPAIVLHKAFCGAAISWCDLCSARCSGSTPSALRFMPVAKMMRAGGVFCGNGCSDAEYPNWKLPSGSMCVNLRSGRFTSSQRYMSR